MAFWYGCGSATGLIHSFYFFAILERQFLSCIPKLPWLLLLLWQIKNQNRVLKQSTATLFFSKLNCVWKYSFYNQLLISSFFLTLCHFKSFSVPNCNDTWRFIGRGSTKMLRCLLTSKEKKKSFMNPLMRMNSKYSKWWHKSKSVLGVGGWRVARLDISN